MTFISACCIALIALAGGFVQSVAGFGSGIVMMLVLPQILGYRLAPGVSSAAGFFLSGIIAWKYRKLIRPRIILLPLLCYSGANILTISFMKNLNTNVLAVGLGVFLTLLSLYFLFLQPRMQVRITKPVLIGFSLFSGFTGGLFGIGGPLMGVSFLEMTDGHEDYVANLQAFFTLTCLTGITTRILNGLLTVSLLPALALSVFGIVLGQKFGLKLSSRLNDQIFKKIVYIFVGLSGLLTLAQHL